MKLLDPFSGYRLSQGHVLLHLAYFIAIFILDKEPICTITDYKGSRTFLLVTHILIFGLSFIISFVAFILKMRSDYEEFSKTRLVIYFELIIIFLLANALEASILLLYQAAIYYVQAQYFLSYK